VIAGNAQHGLGEAAEEAAKAQVAGDIVLHQIAGDQHRRVVRNARKRIAEHRRQLESVSTPRSRPLALP